MNDEAKRQLEIAYNRLMEVNQLARLDLQPLINFDKKKRQQCNDKNCGCYDAKAVVDQLAGLVTENKWLFQTKKEDPQPANRERPDDDPPTIIEIDAETPAELQARSYHSRIRVEEGKRFLAYLTQRFLESYNDQTNRLRHRANCDCITWLSVTFTRIRQKVFRDVMERCIEHNVLATALFCFTLQHEFSNRVELTEMRRTIMRDDNEDFWRNTCRRLFSNWARDRKRSLRNFQPQEARDVAGKYDEIMQLIRRDFPWAFSDDKKFSIKDTLDRADPGPMFQCYRCKRNFPIYASITCKSLSEVPNTIDECHTLCRLCYRQHVASLIEVTKLNERRIAIPCNYENCPKKIIITETTSRFLNRTLRHRLKGMIIRQLVEGLDHPPK